MKKEEALILIRQLETVFDIVRLVNASLTVQCSFDGSGEIVEEPYHCYGFWKKNKRCENCISAKVLGCKRKMTKFEFVDKDVYHVTAIYIEIDAKSYVLEMVSKVTDETIFEGYGKSKFIDYITEYNKKLYIDPVTGAYNRQYYEEQILPLSNVDAAAMLDMDNFKYINDTYGHPAGDCALRCVSKILLSCTESSDMVVRYGGDEFLIVFVNISKEVFSQRLEQIRKSVSAAEMKKYPQIKLSVSIGGAYGKAEVKNLLYKADSMLYRAKISKDSVSISQDGELKEPNGEKNKNENNTDDFAAGNKTKQKDVEKGHDYTQVRKVFDSMPIAFAILKVVLDENGKPSDFVFEYSNDALAELEESTREELMGKKFLDIFSRMDSFRLENYFLAAYRGEYHQLHIYNKHINKYLDIRSYPYKHGYCACIILDETDLVSARDHLIYNSNHDIMTGLGNRNAYRYCCEIFEQKPAVNVGVAVMDINNLRDINNRMGTEYGDKTILKTAECIKMYFTSEQAFRIGSDEFVIVVKDCSNEDFVNDLKKIHNSIKDWGFGGVSCGYIWDKNPKSIRTLFHKADMLMRMEKKTYYLENSTKHVGRNSRLLKKLLEDLDNKRYMIYLQPQFDVSRNNRLVGAEALVRYIDDSGQIVAPADFIEIFEREGIISYLDFAVFEMVCRIISSDREKKPHDDFKIAVNFSRITLASPDFLEKIEKVRSGLDVPASCITIEVTETQETLSEAYMKSLLSKLKEIGYSVSLDDFGTGSSCMENVVMIPWNCLKLDIKLVRELPDSERMSALLSNFCEYCKKYNIVCIAEGVKTEEQLEAVKRIGCGTVQGYYFEKPIPVSDFEKKYLAKNNQ